MRTVESGGIRIAFDDLGSGTPVVLCHSFLCSREMWAGQVPRLAAEYRVVNVDLRGHGESGLAREPFNLDDLVQDVLAVLDELEIPSPVWAGLSVGGMVALRAALHVPDRVRALILFDTDAGPRRSITGSSTRSWAGSRRRSG